MSDARTRLSSAWAVLHPPTGQGFSTFPVAVEGDRDIRAALDSQGLRHLLMAGDDSTVVETASGILSVNYGPLVFRRERRSYLDICCTDPTLNIEFQEVAADIIESTAGRADPVDEALKVIDRWRRLMRASGQGSLREHERIGLFAELSVLVALNNVQTVPASAWTGPLGEPHDFELGERCLEVKGLGRESTAIRVHGLEQLAQHGSKPLHLLLATVVPDPEGITIPELVARVRSLLPRDQDLPERLNVARLNLADPVLRSSFYDICSLYVVDVNSSTPRLVAASLVGGAAPTGVDRVNYEIDVSELLVSSRAASLDRSQDWWAL